MRHRQEYLDGHVRLEQGYLGSRGGSEAVATIALVPGAWPTLRPECVSRTRVC